MEIRINANKEGRVYKGAGMVSGNNSSRLLLDYKYEHPKQYQEILEHIFGMEGLGITHLKLEMGADINSSSGTEPCVKRSADEPVDITRGAGYILAADAKKVNPELTLDMLFWSEPRWVTDADDVYAARYRWYKETLIAAYETFGLKFDYVSVNRNERAVEEEWIKYFVSKIKAETDCPYDFASIGIVAADEDNSWRIADLMMEDEELREAVDIIGTHYTSHCTENARMLFDQYHKELWFSEGCPPMSYSKGTSRFDGSGLSGINGVLDIASRMVAMYPCGGMTLYEYQPVVSAYYDGVTFCHKQLISANEPWSGYYSFDSGFEMAQHFAQFFKKGWRFVDGACHSDGEKGGDGHALIHTVYNYMTAMDPVTGDYSTMMVNATDQVIVYDVVISGLAKASQSVHLWEMRGHDGGSYDENYFRKVLVITPSERCTESGDSIAYSNGQEDTDRYEGADNQEGVYEYSVTVPPFSIATVSTLPGKQFAKSEQETKILHLPYEDDFTYKEYGEDYLASRGYAPRFTTDQGGAFEVHKIGQKHVLMQMITPETKAMEWGQTPLPTTNFGDDRWYQYEVRTEAVIIRTDHPKDNYIGIGLRYNLAAIGMSGYVLLVYEDGTWKFNRNNETKLIGKYDSLECFTADTGTKVSYECVGIGEDYVRVNIRISAKGEDVCGYINGQQVFTYAAGQDKEAILGAGRAALYSSYDRNYFDKVEILPMEDTPYITRYDDTDECFSYEGAWTHNLMSSFMDYRRTVSSGETGAVLALEFEGSGFGLFGVSDGKCAIKVELDGAVVDENRTLPTVGNRELYYVMSNLSEGRHVVKVLVIAGTLYVDGAQIEGIKE